MTYCDYARALYEEGRPASTGECRDLLHALVPRDGSFITCEDVAGTVVQAIWEPGPVAWTPVLWMEVLDPAAECSHGRHVTVAQAAGVLATLAAEGRVALADLGALRTVRWPGVPLAGPV
ncbi:hypothetical protein [Actinomadura hibisca]|uniref:hypothetical protein n=1 Tax=Actinomadura hibisca TaxID=68565 RepID=UPI00082AE95B|nr:hypothetical protein [Actinomadura hibisca]